MTTELMDVHEEAAQERIIENGLERLDVPEGKVRAKVLAEPRGLPFSIMMVPTEQLRFDPRYQRGADWTRIRRIAEDWQPELCFELLCNIRESGDIVVIDGQHRARAAAIAGIPALLCRVHNLTYQQEALLFDAANASSVRIQPSFRFRARIEAGEGIAMAIVRLAEKYGFEVKPTSHTKSPVNLQCVRALEWLHRGKDIRGRYIAAPHPEELDVTLRILSQVWKDQPRRTHGSIVLGLGHFLRTYPEFDEARLVERLETVRPSSLTRSVSSPTVAGGERHIQISAQIWLLYNGKLRQGKLPNRYPRRFRLEDE